MKQSEAIDEGKALGMVATTASFTWFNKSTTKTSHATYVGKAILAALRRRGWTPPKKVKVKK